MRARLGCLSLLLLVASLGCESGGSSHKRKGDGDNKRDKDMEDYDRVGFGQPGRGESAPSVTYGKTADENWKLGEDAFKDEDYLAAQRYYSYIKSKFPYSQFTAQAELRIGDCQFARNRYIEAIDTFQNFVRLHPTHEKVPYALFRTGMCYYHQIPSDWFMLPPSEEKEQTAVRDSERVLKDYCERFPKDSNFAEAKKMLLDVRRKLLAHERYVANFYRGIGKDRAYVGRLQVIRKNFQDVGLDAELLLEIATVYARLGQMDDAKDAVKEMEQKFPGSPKLPTARALVGGSSAAPPPVERNAASSSDGKVTAQE
jgi:outer membrane protein assembly factor BamD